MLNIYNNLRELFLLLQFQTQAILEPYHLTVAQFDTLQHLDPESGWRMGDLRDKVLCTNSKMTRIIDYLEGQRWVERRSNPTDRRSQRVFLTAAGKQQREKALAAHTAVFQQQLTLFSPEEQKQFSAFLIRYKQHFKENAAKT